MGFSRQEYWSGVPLPSPYMQSTSCEMPGWMRQKLESRLPGEISITSDIKGRKAFVEITDSMSSIYKTGYDPKTSIVTEN